MGLKSTMTYIHISFIYIDTQKDTKSGRINIIAYMMLLYIINYYMIMVFINQDYGRSLNFL